MVKINPNFVQHQSAAEPHKKDKAAPLNSEKTSNYAAIFFKCSLVFAAGALCLKRFAVPTENTEQGVKGLTFASAVLAIACLFSLIVKGMSSLSSSSSQKEDKPKNAAAVKSKGEVPQKAEVEEAEEKDDLEKTFVTKEVIPSAPVLKSEVAEVLAAIAKDDCEECEESFYDFLRATFKKKTPTTSLKKSDQKEELTEGSFQNTVVLHSSAKSSSLLGEAECKEEDEGIEVEGIEVEGADSDTEGFGSDADIEIDESERSLRKDSLKLPVGQWEALLDGQNILAKKALFAANGYQDDKAFLRERFQKEIVNYKQLQKIIKDYGSNKDDPGLSVDSVIDLLDPESQNTKTLIKTFISDYLKYWDRTRLSDKDSEHHHKDRITMKALRAAGLIPQNLVAVYDGNKKLITEACQERNQLISDVETLRTLIFRCQKFNKGPLQDSGSEAQQLTNVYQALLTIPQLGQLVNEKTALLDQLAGQAEDLVNDQNPLLQRVRVIQAEIDLMQSDITILVSPGSLDSIIAQTRQKIAQDYAEKKEPAIKAMTDALNQVFGEA